MRADLAHRESSPSSDLDCRALARVTVLLGSAAVRVRFRSLLPTNPVSRVGTFSESRSQHLDSIPRFDTGTTL